MKVLGIEVQLIVACPGVSASHYLSNIIVSHNSGSSVPINGNIYYRNISPPYLIQYYGTLDNTWGLTWDQQKLNNELSLSWRHSWVTGNIVPRAHEASLRVAYQYSVNATSVSPARVPRKGGDIVTVFGKNFIALSSNHNSILVIFSLKLILRLYRQLCSM